MFTHTSESLNENIQVTQSHSPAQRDSLTLTVSKESRCKINITFNNKLNRKIGQYFVSSDRLHMTQIWATIGKLRILYIQWPTSRWLETVRKYFMVGGTGWFANYRRILNKINLKEGCLLTTCNGIRTFFQQWSESNCHADFNKSLAYQASLGCKPSCCPELKVRIFCFG